MKSYDMVFPGDDKEKEPLKSMLVSLNENRILGTLELNPAEHATLLQIVFQFLERMRKDFAWLENHIKDCKQHGAEFAIKQCSIECAQRVLDRLEHLAPGNFARTLDALAQCREQIKGSGHEPN